MGRFMITLACGAHNECRFTNDALWNHATSKQLVKCRHFVSRSTKCTQWHIQHVITVKCRDKQLPRHDLDTVITILQTRSCQCDNKWISIVLLLCHSNQCLYRYTGRIVTSLSRYTCVVSRSTLSFRPCVLPYDYFNGVSRNLFVSN